MKKNLPKFLTVSIFSLVIFVGMLTLIFFIIEDSSWYEAGISRFKKTEKKINVNQVKMNTVSKEFKEKFRILDPRFFETMEELNIQENKIPVSLQNIDGFTIPPMQSFERFSDTIYGPASEKPIEGEYYIPSGTENFEKMKFMNGKFVIRYTLDPLDASRMPKTDNNNNNIPDSVEDIATEIEKAFNNLVTWGFAEIPMEAYPVSVTLVKSELASGVTNAVYDKKTEKIQFFMMFANDLSLEYTATVIQHEMTHLMEFSNSYLNNVYNTLYDTSFLRFNETAPTYLGLKAGGYLDTSKGFLTETNVLTNRFSIPQYSLYDSSMRTNGWQMYYASYIFYQLLEDKTTNDPTFLSAVFNKAETENINIFEALKGYYQEQGLTGNMFEEYALCNIFIGPYANYKPDGCYKRASKMWTLWGSVSPEKVIQNYPVLNAPNENEIEGTGTAYLKFKNIPENQSLKITLTPDSTGRLSVATVKIPKNGITPEITRYGIINDATEIIISGENQYHAFLVLTNTQTDDSSSYDVNYTYSAELMN